MNSDVYGRISYAESLYKVQHYAKTNGNIPHY